MRYNGGMRRRLLVLLLLPLLALASCASPAAEISLTTLTPDYAGHIFIGGGVSNPGIYPYAANDSLADLIRAAGGLKDGADASEVELSFGAADIPQKIDLNRAGAWLLSALPGIGEVTAQRIVSYREASGPFRSPSDLLKVEGIGPATLDKIAAFVTVGGD